MSDADAAAASAPSCRRRLQPPSHPVAAAAFALSTSGSARGHQDGMGPMREMAPGRGGLASPRTSSGNGANPIQCGYPLRLAARRRDPVRR